MEAVGVWREGGAGRQAGRGKKKRHRKKTELACSCPSSLGTALSAQAERDIHTTAQLASLATACSHHHLGHTSTQNLQATRVPQAPAGTNIDRDLSRQICESKLKTANEHQIRKGNMSYTEKETEAKQGVSYRS